MTSAKDKDRVQNIHQSKCITKFVKEEEHVMFKWIWKVANRVRHKIFCWLLMHDRVNTRNILRKKFIWIVMIVSPVMSMLRKWLDIFLGTAALHKTVAAVSHQTRDWAFLILMTFSWHINNLHQRLC